MSAMFCLNVAVAFGLGGIIAGSPGLSRVLQVAGMGYMVYLGAKILRLQLKETLEPMRFSFVEGFLIHPFSPKSWAMSVVGYTQLAEPDASVVLQASVFAGTFLLQQAVFHSMWALAGARLVGLLRQGRMLRAVTATCVVLMLTSTAWAMFA
jgi:threonine/homoserine/homoserine lactone efflux protein